MESFTFDPVKQGVEQLNAHGEPLTIKYRFKGFLKGLTGIGSEADYIPANRENFFLNAKQLSGIVSEMDVEITDEGDAAHHLWLPYTNMSRRLDIPANRQLSGEAVDVLTRHDPGASRALRHGIRSAKSAVIQQASESAWWLTYANKNEYSHNPFEQDPTEQYVIHLPGADVNIYNFAGSMSKAELAEITHAIYLTSQLTNGLSARLVPNVVIHNAFIPRYFDRDNRVMRPDGQAWQGKPFIEINGTVLGTRGYGDRGSLGQSWLERVAVHELTHQVDDVTDDGTPSFKQYFKYVDTDGDHLIDQIKPRETIVRLRQVNHRSKRGLIEVYGEKAVKASAPYRDYGYTNATEDLTVTSEEAAFGGIVDAIRRDAFIDVLQKFVIAFDNSLGAKLGPSHPDYLRLVSKDINDHPIAVPVDQSGQVDIERRTGSEVILPTVDILQAPLKVSVAFRHTLGKRLLNRIMS